MSRLPDACVQQHVAAAPAISWWLRSSPSPLLTGPLRGTDRAAFQDSMYRSIRSDAGMVPQNEGQSDQAGRQRAAAKGARETE